MNLAVVVATAAAAAAIFFKAFRMAILILFSMRIKFEFMFRVKQK